TFQLFYAEGGTRTRRPSRGAFPSRWCVCQFHHFGEVLLLFRRGRCRRRFAGASCPLSRRTPKTYFRANCMIRGFPDASPFWKAAPPAHCVGICAPFSA